MDHGLVIPKILNMVRNAALLGIQYEGLDLEKFPVKYWPGGVLVHQAASGHIIWPRNQQMDCQFQQTILHSHWSPYYPYIAVKIAWWFHCLINNFSLHKLKALPVNFILFSYYYFPRALHRIARPWSIWYWVLAHLWIRKLRYEMN